MFNKDSPLWLVKIQTRPCSSPFLGPVQLIASSPYLCGFVEFHISVFNLTVKKAPVWILGFFCCIAPCFLAPAMQYSASSAFLCLDFSLPNEQDQLFCLGFSCLHLRKPRHSVCWAPLAKRVITHRWQSHRHSHSWCLCGMRNPQHTPWTSRLGLGRSFCLGPGASKSSDNHSYVLVSKTAAVILMSGKDLRIQPHKSKFQNSHTCSYVLDLKIKLETVFCM